MLMQISIIFFIISILFKIFRPKKRNFLYGYRTYLSKSSQFNWDEAQRYSSTIFIIASIILFIFAIIFEFTKLPYEQLTTIILILGTIISIFAFTEQHLKKIKDNINKE